MAQQHEQKITVRPDTLPNLIADIAKGNYRVPQFQREFVWNTKKIIELFDSIHQEFIWFETVLSADQQSQEILNEE